MIQTYQPDNYAIVHAANQDYEGFYEEEITYRELMLYPPVANMMGVLVMSGDEFTGMEYAKELSDSLKSLYSEYRPAIIGPASAAIGKIQDVYRYVFYIKHKDYDVLVKMNDTMESIIEEKGWNKESVQFDFNPVNIA